MGQLVGGSMTRSVRTSIQTERSIPSKTFGSFDAVERPGERVGNTTMLRPASYNFLSLTALRRCVQSSPESRLQSYGADGWLCRPLGLLAVKSSSRDAAVDFNLLPNHSSTHLSFPRWSLQGSHSQQYFLDFHEILFSTQHIQLIRMSSQSCTSLLRALGFLPRI
jgi:hypothetical protein